MLTNSLPRIVHRRRTGAWVVLINFMSALFLEFVGTMIGQLAGYLGRLFCSFVLAAITIFHYIYFNTVVGNLAKEIRLIYNESV